MINPAELRFGDEFWTVITTRSSQMVPFPSDESPRFAFQFSIRRAVCIRHLRPGALDSRADEECILAAAEGSPVRYTTLLVPVRLVFPTAEAAWQWIQRHHEQAAERTEFMLTDLSNNNPEEE